MADGVAITAGAGTTILTDDTGATGHAQVFKLAISTDGSATLVPADATNGLDVDVTRLPALVAGTAYIGKVRLTDGTNDQVVASNGGAAISGCTAHDSADAGNPVKIGAKAVAAGSMPTNVAAGDRTDLIANRAGMLYVIGGAPGQVTTRHTNITTAVSNTQMGPAVGAGQRMCVTRLTVTLDSASTVFPSVLIGFGAANTPTGDGVIAYHGGVPAGGGFTIGDGTGMIGCGAADEELRITTTGNATGNGVSVSFTYYLIDA